MQVRDTQPNDENTMILISRCCPKTPQRFWRKTQQNQGFTLVELLVAMTIATIIFAIGWRFLDTTASASREVASASSAIDENRSALYELSKNLQIAASNATPNSQVDPKVLPKGRMSQIGVVTGIYPYINWQTPIIWNEGQPPTPNPADPIITANPAAVFDGLVILSGYSYPLPFEARFDSPRTDQLTIPDTPRGLRRLATVNPFVVPNTTATDNPLNDPQWSARLIRLLDPEGFKQFASVTAVDAGAATLTVTPAFTQKASGQNFGVDIAAGANDRLYDTAALDLFWYYVRRDPDPSNPNNLQLVRERLCARTAILAFGQNPASFAPQNHIAGGDCGRRETLVLANQIASFDAWFECGTPIGTGQRAPVANQPSPPVWNIQDNSCLQGQTNSPLQNARIAHIRISTHPNTERRSITDPNFFTQNQRLIAFDFNDDYPGAAPVTTLQNDVFMRNFLYW